jgi:hypothetical protein
MFIKPYHQAPMKVNVNPYGKLGKLRAQSPYAHIGMLRGQPIDTMVEKTLKLFHSRFLLIILLMLLLQNF